jgi:hypothetical protein
VIHAAKAKHLGLAIEAVDARPIFRLRTSGARDPLPVA